MGLTNASVGKSCIPRELSIRLTGREKIIALGGNPNVGKSTLFNNLTGMRQHTGNWPGKTVATAFGSHHFNGKDYIFVDLPGSYSLIPASPEEEAAADFICFGNADATVMVCDATSLERSLNPAIQAAEITGNVIICINLTDEAAKKGIEINYTKLEYILGIKVIPVCARTGKGIDELMKAIEEMTESERVYPPLKLKYPHDLEKEIDRCSALIKNTKLSPHWLSLKLIENSSAGEKIKEQILTEKDALLIEETEKSSSALLEKGFDSERICEINAEASIRFSEKAANNCIKYKNEQYDKFDRRADKILTGKLTGIPVMVLLLLFVFWLTIYAANYPSSLLSDFLFSIGEKLTKAMTIAGAPQWLTGIICDGAYRVLAWVVSVMLPPMAIFFPLFTLLEDSGYLPRIAFNLDKPFKKAGTCGKQALTMCMGFGCNAAGVTGCRIISSPRERIIATVTNAFVPCNGRFPALIAIITMFFAGASAFCGAAMLTGVILFGVFMTFLVSYILSKTLLKGVPSFFSLEMPPYRKPQIGKVIVRSIFDRTLFVLARAAAVAAPAGVIIWLAANIQIDGISLLNHCAAFLDPFAALFGLDGVILIAFILGFPANEIVVPIILMAYTCSGTITEMGDLTSLYSLLTANGWTEITAISFLLFSLMHWPCSTTLLTVKKETGSLKWTLLSALIPTAAGFIICFIFANIVRIFI